MTYPPIVSALLSKTTLDIIGRAALGFELNSLSSGSTFAECYATIFELSTLAQIITVVHQYVPVRQWLPFRVNREFVHACAEIIHLLREHIRRRKQEVYGSEKPSSADAGRDLLTVMVEQGSKDRDAWTEDEMLGHLRNFMAAGHETTATALTWTLHALTLHPEMQFRLREEIRAAFSNNQDLTVEQLDSLKFLNNVVRETLRVYPPCS